MMLPNINQQAQGLNVQTPRVPSGNQMMGAASQARANMPQRPVQSMAPDNGQHGGAQRYMTPLSGAMNVSNQLSSRTSGREISTPNVGNSPIMSQAISRQGNTIGNQVQGLRDLMPSPNQRPANPYGNQSQVYPGQRPPPTMSSQPQAMANQQPVMPQIFNTGLQSNVPQVQQPVMPQPQAVSAQQPQQRQMPYNMALQQRIMGGQMPPMFGPVGP